MLGENVTLKMHPVSNPEAPKGGMSHGVFDDANPHHVARWQCDDRQAHPIHGDAAARDEQLVNLVAHADIENPRVLALFCREAGAPLAAQRR